MFRYHFLDRGPGTFDFGLFAGYWCCTKDALLEGVRLNMGQLNGKLRMETSHVHDLSGYWMLQRLA